MLLSRGILKQRRGKCSINFNGDFFKSTELLSQIVHYVRQLRVHGAVANWCYQFGLTEGERTSRYPRGQQNFDCGWTTRSEIVGFPSDSSTWKQGARKRIELQNTGKEDTANTTWRESLLLTSCDCRELLQNSTTCWRRVVRNYSFVPIIFEFSILSENQTIVSSSRRHHHWTSFGSSRCENSWQLLKRSCNSVDCKPRIHNLRGYIHWEGAFCEIHNRKQELRSSNELLENLHKSGGTEEVKVTWSHKETLSAPSTKETGADPVILTPRASLFKKTLPRMRKWITIPAHSRYGRDLAESVSQLATTMLRHYDQDERQRDGFRHWDSLKQYWWKRLHTKKFETLMVDIGYAWFMRAVQRTGLKSVKIKIGIYVISELFRDTLVVFQQVQNWWNIHLFYTIGKSTFITEEVNEFSTLIWRVE